MKYYAVIDTNVLVSALLKSESVPGKLMDLVFDGDLIPVINEEILSEYMAVLSRKKFSFPVAIINAVLEGFRARAVSAEQLKTDFLFPDPKDAVFFEVTMAARKSESTFLVTGNLKHFPKKPFVVSPREMLSIILDINT